MFGKTIILLFIRNYNIFFEKKVRNRSYARKIHSSDCRQTKFTLPASICKSGAFVFLPEVKIQIPTDSLLNFVWQYNYTTLFLKLQHIFRAKQRRPVSRSSYGRAQRPSPTYFVASLLFLHPIGIEKILLEYPTLAEPLGEGYPKAY